MRLWEMKVVKQQPGITALLIQLYFGAALPRMGAGPGKCRCQFAWDAFMEGVSAGEKNQLLKYILILTISVKKLNRSKLLGSSESEIACDLRKQVPR